MFPNSHIQLFALSRRFIFNGGVDSGFSVVDIDCFDFFSHTHEMGHNLGCDHNRENAVTEVTENEFGYGTLHCTTTDP